MSLECWFDLQRAHDATRACLDNLLRSRGFMLEQCELCYTVLELRRDSDDPTPANIARWLGKKSHSVSGLIDRATKAGLVTRERGTLGHRNLVRVVLTDKGYEANSALTDVYENVVQNILERRACPFPEQFLSDVMVAAIHRLALDRADSLVETRAA